MAHPITFVWAGDRANHESQINYTFLRLAWARQILDIYTHKYPQKSSTSQKFKKIFCRRFFLDFDPNWITLQIQKLVFGPELQFELYQALISDLYDEIYESKPKPEVEH